MASIDNGEEKLERVSSDITREGTRVVARYSGEITKAVMKAMLHKALDSLRWTMAAVQRPGGEVSMKQFSELPSRAGREVVSLDDRDVMHALEKNLKGRGVHYALEREKIDGKVQHVLHVRGDDAQVVADSLERAAKAVDAKRELTQDRQQAKQPAQDHSHKGPEQSKTNPKAGESTQPKRAETAPSENRSKADTAHVQKDLRQKVKTRAAEIKADSPKQSPKIDVPSPGLKR